MPRLHSVAKAQKSPGNCRKCGDKIEVGDSYCWFKNRVRPVPASRRFFVPSPNAPPRASDMTTSDKLSQVYVASESLEEAITAAGCPEDLETALNEAAEQAREVAENHLEEMKTVASNACGEQPL